MRRTVCAVAIASSQLVVCAVAAAPQAPGPERHVADGARAMDKVRWRPLAAGEQEATAAGRPVLYFFTADWCSPCLALKKTVFAEQDVAEFIEARYVPVEIVDRSHEDGENPLEVDATQMRFLVPGFPTLVVARPKNGYGVSSEGFLGRDQALQFILTGGDELGKVESQAARERQRPERSDPR